MGLSHLERKYHLCAEERDRWKARAEAAQKVVSYIVIFGAAPTQRLAELVGDAMQLATIDAAARAANEAREGE